MPSKLFAAFVGTLLGAMSLAFPFQAAAASNPVPSINLPLSPDAIAPGKAGFTLKVNGTGFVAQSVVNWNGSPRKTTFVSKFQLTAKITTADIAKTGTASVTVVSPAPGGGTSNVAFLSITNPTPNVGFRLGSSPTAGNTPDAAAVGDFNGDGRLDLAVANYESNTVSILLGDGMGNFTLASSPATGSFPDSVAVGDFNGDGKLDIAVANHCGGGDCFSAGTVSILLGDGTGNFTLASSPGTGENPDSVAVGDFNGDGKLDLAVVNYDDRTISILLGDGTGNFNPAPSLATGFGPASIAVGDFNGDGNLDLAVATDDPGAVLIFLGDGTGNFTLLSSIPSGSGADAVAVGDFNADGNLDLAVANVFDYTVYIFLGDGAGGFTFASSSPTGVNPDSVAVGDFNGDGKPDLAVASDTLSILLGDGTGNLTLASSPTGLGGGSVALGDFNGDGKLDIAAEGTNGAVAILLQALL